MCKRLLKDSPDCAGLDLLKLRKRPVGSGRGTRSDPHDELYIYSSWRYGLLGFVSSALMSIQTSSSAPDDFLRCHEVGGETDCSVPERQCLRVRGALPKTWR